VKSLLIAGMNTLQQLRDLHGRRGMLLHGKWCDQRFSVSCGSRMHVADVESNRASIRGMGTPRHERDVMRGSHTPGPFNLYRGYQVPPGA
jgi:hypothetical protein